MAEMADTKKSGLYLAIIIATSFFAFFINNHVVPADLMESRNLATAQEMVRTGNYLVPTMNGELRLEKPPLPTWIAATIEIVLPGNLVAQRSAAGIAATLMAIFLYLLMSHLTKSRNIGLAAALILASMFNPVMMGRTATWDIYCHSFMLGAIYFMVLGFEKEGRQWGRFTFAGLFMGLSFLSKGPVSFYALLLPFLIGYIFALRPSIRKKGKPILAMILICLLVSFWWPLYLYIFHTDTALMVLGKESAAWTGHNVRPFWYYWLFFAEGGIWALFWITSIIFFFRKGRLRKHRRIFLFSIVWTISALVLLSLIPEKKTRYLLPVLIPGAINVCFYIWYSMRYAMTRTDKAVFRLNGIIISLILAGLPAGLYIMFVKTGLMGMGLFCTITIISVSLALFILASLFGKKGIGVKNVFATVILTMIMVETFCLGAIGQVFINDDRHSIRMLRGNPAVEGLPFYHDSREPVRMELVYEANQTILPLDISDDSSVYGKLPFVFVGGLPADSVFSGKAVEITYIDTFDNNWRKKDHRKHNKALVKTVSIIKRAKPETVPAETEE